MQLAKSALDIGLFTNELAPMAEFWTSLAGVEFDFVQPISRSVKQHRFNLGDGVLKINQVREQLPDGPSGFGRVLVASDAVESPEEYRDSDGTAMVLWPRGKDGVEHWAVEVLAPSERSFLDFYVAILGLPRAVDHPCAVCCGVSLLTCVVAGSDQLPLGEVAADISLLQLRGLRYFTIQVRDVDAVYSRVRSAAACVALAPVTLGETARIAFVRDPVGNYIELSQRASLTGALPD